MLTSVSVDRDGSAARPMDAAALLRELARKLEAHSVELTKSTGRHTPFLVRDISVVVWTGTAIAYLEMTEDVRAE